MNRTSCRVGISLGSIQAIALHLGHGPVDPAGATYLIGGFNMRADRSWNRWFDNPILDKQRVLRLDLVGFRDREARCQ